MIAFKTKRIKDEFYSPSIIKPKLKTIIYMLDTFCSIEFKHHREILLTELYRIQAEQDLYYKDNEKYIIKPWPSVHQYGRGADIRTKSFQYEEIQKILDFLNKITYKKNSKTKTAIYHDIGLGDHIHLQIA